MAERAPDSAQQRDPYSGERVVWRGKPQVVELPPLLRIAALVSFGIGFVSLCFAVVIAKSLGIAPTPSFLFAFWSASLGVVFWKGPKLWLEGVEYVVTEQRVLWRRGPFSRSLGRDSVSFVRIFWSANAPGAGDLEFVRAVPTGALRRRLRLRLSGVSAPARVAAIVLGREHVTPAASEGRPLTQRLEAGERVLWAARPRKTARTYLPRGRDGWLKTALFALLVVAFVRLLAGGVPAVERLIEAGMPVRSLSFVALVAGLSVTGLIVVLTAAYAAFDSVVRPSRLEEQTRYLVTNRRVLIQRGREELYLDRARIVDVIDAPAGAGISDVFLVLDGPRARALAASGAFGERERGPSLVPVLERVEDADGVRQVLSERSEPNLPRAA